MITESLIQPQGITRIEGLELNRLENGNLIFQPHEYIGKEPDTKFFYLLIKRVADKLEVPVNVASFMCSDEENGLERVKRAFYFSKVFATDIIGPVVLSQPSHVANNVGHSSHIFIVTGHIGMYKNEKDGRLLYGKLESERDSLLRPTCGAIYHVMERFLGKHQLEVVSEWDIDFIGKLEYGLNPYKQEFLKEYNKGKDELEKISIGMKYLLIKNVDVQINHLLQVLKNSGKDNHKLPKLIFGGVTINRYKYSDTTLMTQAYLLKEGNAIDLTKIPI